MRCVHAVLHNATHTHTHARGRTHISDVCRCACSGDSRAVKGANQGGKVAALRSTAFHRGAPRVVHSTHTPYTHAHFPRRPAPALAAVHA